MKHQGLGLSLTRRQLMRVLAQPRDQVDLAEAALLVAAEEYPDLDIAFHLQRVRDLAAEVSDLEAYPLLDSARRLSEVLHDRHGFIGTAGSTSVRSNAA